MPPNGKSERRGETSEIDDKASTTSRGRAAGRDSSDHTRDGADEDIEDGTTPDDITDEAQGGTSEQEEDPGVLAALWIMFSTTQNASFFVSVTLSGMGKGVIDTFLFVW